MKRLSATLLLLALVLALGLPAAAKETRKTDFALSGEARALELALGEEGVTLGLALARANSSPEAIGVGAAQCAVLGEDSDPDDLPCSDANTEKSRYPGNPGDEAPACSAEVPPPLSDVIQLELACGSSQSSLSKGLPATTNRASVGQLDATLPVRSVLPVDATSTEQLVDDITHALGPVLDKAPKQVKDAVDQVVGLLEDVAATDAVAARIGASSSDVVPSGATIAVESSAAGALVGVLGIPSVDAGGEAIVNTADPLKNGLLIVEVGTAQASATIDTRSADATAKASPAIVTVKVRDITKEEPTYVTVTVAPGETVTLLGGTPAESTITAAESVTEEKDGSARAAADAVRLHLLKGVQGGLKLGLGRATAAASAKPVAAVKPAPRVQNEPETLPVTGGGDFTGPAIVLLLAATGALAARRRFSTR